MDNPTAAIELDAVTRRFGTVVAVNDLTLTVQPGEVVALLGPNGAGKSTTTEMMLGLTNPDAGSVRIFGHTPQRATERGLVGAMLQNGALLDDVRVGDMLRLLHAIQAHPLPLATVVERAGIAELMSASTGKLSGGQAQRVRYAMAIMADPQLILLDEPTVAFDVETRRRFWDDMRAFAAGGRTVVFATHYLEEADEFADRVVMMRHGQVVADGTGAQIKQHAGGRLVSFVADPVAAGAPDADWAGLPGVTGVQQVGGRLQLRSTDSDATLRALLGGQLAHVGVHDIEVGAPSLEDAFLELTA